MKKFIIFFAVIMAALTIRSEASEITIGVAPDPYEAIWQQATEEDIEALKQVVWYEAALADCPMEVNVAVVETVLNRCLSDAFPATIRGVCYQSGQFYHSNTKIENKAVSEAIEAVRENGRTVLPSENYVYFATKMQSCARNHVWIGSRKANGKPLKSKGMYFAEGK